MPPSLVSPGLLPTQSSSHILGRPWPLSDATLGAGKHVCLSADSSPGSPWPAAERMHVGPCAHFSLPGTGLCPAGSWAQQAAGGRLSDPWPSAAEASTLSSAGRCVHSGPWGDFLTALLTPSPRRTFPASPLPSGASFLCAGAQSPLEHPSRRGSGPGRHNAPAPYGHGTHGLKLSFIP